LKVRYELKTKGIKRSRRANGIINVPASALKIPDLDTTVENYFLVSVKDIISSMP
jgi:hypothetical protein